VSTAGGQGAKDQVARLLTLVPLLHVHGQMRLGDAAETLGVSPGQLLSDLKVLFLVGLPGGYPDDLIDVDLDRLEGPEGPLSDGLIRISNADYLARPLRLTATEASAVIVALRAMRNGAEDDTREIVDRALAKLEAAAAAGPAATTIDPGPDAADPAALALADRLRRATEQRRQVRLTYYVPARDEESDRVVDPRGVVAARGLTYLDAWCHSAEAPRLFRLDRIAAAEVLESPIATPPKAPRNLTEGIFAQSDDTTLVTLRLTPAARWVVEYYPVEAVRTERWGAVEVDLLVADRRWLRRLLLRLAPNAEVLEPPEYADDFTAAAQAALDLYA
jgi:proteasome accessory factor C